MRTFITLEFDKKTKEEIIEIQKMIRENSYSGRFKYIDNFHLTLKFLGETDLITIDMINDELNKKLKGFKCFKLNFSGIGAFGVGRTTRTIYLKVKNPLDRINHLFNIVDEATALYGFKLENKYVPHVTIAQDVELKIPFNEIADKSESLFNKEIFFDKLVIMKSEQKSGKRIYSPLKTILFDK
ncbi:2'-5' RNA ligase [Caloramator quimbayensis]|uniref:RNA 2',3'-cyclic phosphodiesterase n=1 Tax=Caloramator quimbayensis TaxID=1147123 RepID=A0A1T4X2F4_9CLOT|nr:RNA 2',3'-cyclic phosphodiesterase [Caloramator quimbayensis]SKA83770.1 2'-5' RNA ligase [Caloramator quimbayensis]